MADEPFYGRLSAAVQTIQSQISPIELMTIGIEYKDFVPVEIASKRMLEVTVNASVE